MSVKLSCPSCNAAFVLPAVPASGRAECPRCGDPFPVRSVEEVADGALPFAESEPGAERKRGGKWRLIALGLLVAVGIGTFFGLREKGPEPLPEPPATARLAGVGYLPPQCNLVFGLEVAPVLDAAARANQPPREFLEANGLPRAALAALDAAGLPFERLDHIVGGVRAGAAEGDALALALCAVTKDPVDAAELAKRLKAKPAKRPGRWGVLLERVPLPLVLAVPRPNVVLFGLDDERDFSALVAGPDGFGPGGAQFRGTATDGLRGLLNAVPDRAAVWAVADDETDWTAKPLVKLFAQQPVAKAALAHATAFRGGLFALGADGAARVRVRTADAATGERVRAYFARVAADVPNARVGGAGATATYDATHPPAESLALLNRFLTDLGK
jgi:hypothetical protein